MKYSKQFEKWFLDHYNFKHNPLDCYSTDSWTAAEQFFVPMLEEAERSFHRIIKELKYGPHPSMQWVIAETEEALEKIAKMKGER